MLPGLILVAAFALAAAAAWQLARSLGLSRAGAALAAAGSALSGRALVALGVPAAHVVPPAFDAAALGALLLAAGAVSVARRTPAPGPRGAWRVPQAIGFALLALALAFVLARRGLPDAARSLLVPAGPLAHGWVAPPILALALASVASARGALRGRGACAAVGFVALLVALGEPGTAGLARRLPLEWETVVALAATVAPISLSLLAGDALESAPRSARLAAGLALVAWGALALVPRDAGPAGSAGDPDDELVVFTERPPARASGGAVRVAGRIHASVPGDGLRLALAPEDAASPARSVPIQSRVEPDGWRAFESAPVDVAHLAPGPWRLDVEVLRAGEPIGARTAGVVRIERGADPRALALGLAAAVLALSLRARREPS